MKAENWLLLFVINANALCEPGFLTGIDMNGNADSSNVENCYPSRESAFIMSCNNGLSAEMKISIKKVKIILSIM